MSLLLRVSVGRSASRLAPAGLALALVAAFLAWAPAPPAAAHAALLTSDPPEAALVQTLPSRATLTFTAQVKEVHEITVTGPDGSVANGEATPAGIEVRQNLWGGPDGPYTISYDVVAADGHEVNGEIHFDVGALSTTAGGESTAESAGLTSDEGVWAKGRAAILPAAVILLAGAGALVLLRRQRVRRE